ncbi:hypothetical protein L873DRAFT_1661934 [Choiromyces venosus 120613-1]|uniref:Integral membrane protein n=1 Tax=Choiromyces venosus 120613-1 TaxID=1336337 RepID=A0A3N4K577_9PEZI|nr:hypothetical protein L873DRAFT_1661934 [Choiromyces venosus 120613-1]
MSLHRRYLPLILLSIGTRLVPAAAHDHHGEGIPEGEAVSPDPLDSILWIHIFTMISAFGIIFPFGMVLGIVRSRWHVPVQVLGTALAVLGWLLGHAHKGRQFAPNIHAAFATSLMSMLALQVGLGIYLKLHLEKGWHGVIRRHMVRLHGIVGKVMPVVSWTQMLFGGITAMGFCRADHQGQCLAHFIMGSSFIGYGMIMVIMLFAGQAWLKRTGKSQEFWDSLVITVWVTEHRWGQEWVHNDIQHTTMGVVWWCAGLLGLWLSRGNNRQPKRNLIPGIVIFLTGYAMSAHPQHLPLSTMVHTVFGYTLMAAGLTRVIEIAFVLRDKATLDGEPNSFQHMTPFLLFASGFIFMCATEEQLALVSSIGIDHVSYLLVLYSVAFLTYLFTMILVHTYISNPRDVKHVPPAVAAERGMNGHADRRVHDAEEFELEGLISEDEEEGNKRE